MKTIKLTPFTNFSKILGLMKNYLKPQTEIHDTAKQKIIHSGAEFPTKICHSVFRNSV